MFRLHGAAQRGDRVRDLQVERRHRRAVGVDERERLTLLDRRRVLRLAAGAQVAGHVLEVLDLHGVARRRAVRQRQRVGHRRRRGAVHVVLGQVAVRDAALPGDGVLERVDAAVAVHRDVGHHDPHRLVPRAELGLVRGGGPEHVALVHVNAPLGQRSGHRDVPGVRVPASEVVRGGAEDAYGRGHVPRYRAAPGARHLGAGSDHHQVVVEAARVQVAGNGHEGARVGQRPLVQLAPVGIGVRRLVGEGELPVLAAAAQHVEDGIRVPVLHVHPHGLDRLHLLAERRVQRHEVHVVGDVDRVRLVREVVDHVVDQPAVARPGEVAVRRGDLEDRLLLAGGEEALRQARRARVLRAHVDEDAVVQVQLVGGRHRAAGGLEVRLQADDVAVLSGLLGGGGIAAEDQVRARLDVKRPVAEVEVLHALGRGRRGGLGDHRESGEGEHGDAEALEHVRPRASQPPGQCTAPRDIRAECPVRR